MHFKKVNQGDILEMNLAPVKGQEQDGKRPVVVVSGAFYNSKCNGLFIIMPISNTTNTFPMHISIPKGSAVTGSVLTQHQRTVDLKSRAYNKIGKLDEKTLAVCIEVAKSSYD